MSQSRTEVSTLTSLYKLRYGEAEGDESDDKVQNCERHRRTYRPQLVSRLSPCYVKIMGLKRYFDLPFLLNKNGQCVTYHAPIKHTDFLKGAHPRTSLARESGSASLTREPGSGYISPHTHDRAPNFSRTFQYPEWVYRNKLQQRWSF
jgi:hypothetical protein